jgi:type I restriction enzyme S subunit
MKSEWKTIRADEFCSLVTDGTHDSPKPQAAGRKLITSKHLKGYYLDFESANWISSEDYEKVIARSSVEQWDILYSMIGTIGNVYLEKNPVVDYACKNVGIFKFGGNCNKAYWMYYYLKSPQAMEFIKAHLRGTTQLYVPLATLREMPVPVPDEEEMNKIVAILRTLDDKIQCSIKINDNLLRQAQALYKNRFIDLKPFNGEMPPDWQLGTVSEIIELHDSKRIPLSSRERANLTKIYPYYGATSVMDYVDSYLFDGIYLLLGEDGTVVDDKGFPILQYVEGKFWVNNHAHIITGKNGFTVETLYLLFSLTNVRSIVTGAVQPKISQANLNNVSVVIPSKAELSTFNSIVQPIFSQIRNLRAESDRLTATRDILLPRLMSGEIDATNIQL